MSAPVYRYHASQSDGWRFHYSLNPQLGEGWTFDGIAFNIPLIHYETVPIYQFHYDQSKTYGGWRFHFSRTMNPQNQGWTFDGKVFEVFAQQNDSTVPVYQYHCQQKDGWRHFLTTSEQAGKQGWIFDKILFWAYPGEVK